MPSFIRLPLKFALFLKTYYNKTVCSFLKESILKMRKVFVAALNWNTDEDALSNHFSAIGPVEEAIIIKDRDTKRSKGFGFVTFANKEDADRAIQELDNSELDGKTIKVDIAKERR